MRVSLVALLLLTCASADAQLWNPPDLKLPPLSVNVIDGKIDIKYDPKHCYQHAFTRGVTYSGTTATTEYIEIFTVEVPNPATRIGWKSRSAIFLYVRREFSTVASDGSMVEVRSSGENFLLVIYYAPKNEVVVPVSLTAAGKK